MTISVFCLANRSLFFFVGTIMIIIMVMIITFGRSCVIRKVLLYSEGPATGHLDTGFSWFPYVYKQMLRWFPRLQVATTCFSRSPPDLNLLVTNLIFCMYVYIGFKISFYVVRHLDSIASYLPTGLFHISYTCKITTATG